MLIEGVIWLRDIVDKLLVKHHVEPYEVEPYEVEEALG